LDTRLNVMDGIEVKYAAYGAAVDCLARFVFASILGFLFPLLGLLLQVIMIIIIILVVLFWRSMRDVQYK
jgi:hypothetical protein